MMGEGKNFLAVYRVIDNPKERSIILVFRRDNNYNTYTHTIVYEYSNVLTNTKSVISFDEKVEYLKKLFNTDRVLTMQ